MLCAADKFLSVFMTLRMCLHEVCCLFVMFYCLDLNHLVHLFVFLLETAGCCHLGFESVFSSVNHRYL